MTNLYIDTDDSFNCEICCDTGVIIEDEEDGEGHIMSGVGSRRCPCTYDDIGREIELYD